MRDVRQDPAVDDNLRQRCVQLQVISYLDVPVMKNGQPAGVLCLVQSQPRAWTAADAALAAEVAERTWAAVERARAETALAASEEKYRTLFNSIDEGFCVQELVFDQNGQVVDLIYREANAAFERHTGLADAKGKLASEVFPHTEPYWFDSLTRVYQTGTTEQTEGYNADTGRWLTSQYLRIGSANSPFIAAVFSDITERKQHEQQQEFLLQFSDALRTEPDADAMADRALTLLIEQLGLDRCYIAEYHLEADHADIPHQAGNERVPPLPAGGIRLSDFPEAFRVVFDRTLVIDDCAATAGLSDTDRHNIGALGLRALVAATLRRGEHRPHWVIVAVSASPRHWTPAEVALLEEVTERTWIALERARAEAARQLSEQRLRALVENLPGAAVFIVDRELRYQLAEGEALANAGLAAADLLGRTVAEAMPPELVATYETYYRQALAGQRFAIEHAAHGHVYISRGMPLPGPAGPPEAALVVSYDITARKQAEAALAASEENYRVIVNQAVAGIFKLDLSGRVIFSNERFGQVLGYAPAELLRLRVADLVHPDDLARTTAEFGRLVTEGRSFGIEKRLLRKDGSVIWVNNQISPIFGPDKQPLAAAVVSIDITAHKRAEEALRNNEVRLEHQVTARTHELRESRDLLQSVLDTSLISVTVLRAVRAADGTAEDFEFVLVNKAHERMSSAPHLMGRRYTEIYPGTRQSEVWQNMLRVLETGQPLQAELHYPRGSVDRWFEYQFGKLGDGLVATTLDITARKQAEEERFKNLHLLEQAEVVAGLGSWDYHLPTGRLQWSDGMYQLFGLPLGQAVRPELYVAFAVADDQPRAVQLVARLTSGTESFEETLRLRVGEQLKTIRIKAVVLRDEAGQPVRVLGVDLDISALQRLEADNLRLRLTQQKALFEAVQAAQEAERKRMAESLHNGIGQILYATKLRLDRLHSSLLGTDPALVAARREADQLLADAIRQTRALSHELVPLVLQEFGLAAALQDISAKMSTPQLRLRSHVLLDEAAAPLAPALQMALYRMAQELAQNIIKHARGATRASLELETMPGWVLLRAEDNGPGFAAAPDGSPGLGLRSIRDRVALLGGQLERGSIPSGGAYVRIRIPLPDFLST